MDQLKCQYCDYVCQSSSTLRSHRSRKHKGVVAERNNKICELSKFPLETQPLTYEDYVNYKAILTDKFTYTIDGLSKATEVDINNLIESLKMVLSKENYLEYNHVICLDTSYLQFVPCVKEVLPLSCRCFCNLLKCKEEEDASGFYHEHVQEILGDLFPYWHYHCLAKIDTNVHIRTRQRQFEQVFGKKNYRCLVINSMFHLMNSYLYILGIQSSKQINCHLFSSYNFYLLPYQKAYVMSTCKNLFPCKTDKELSIVSNNAKKRKLYFSKILYNVKKSKTQ